MNKTKQLSNAGKKAAKVKWEKYFEKKAQKLFDEVFKKQQISGGYEAMFYLVSKYRIVKR